jgi:hypothetical protein
MKQQRIMVSATVITTIASLITGYLIGKYTSQNVNKFKNLLYNLTTPTKLNITIRLMYLLFKRTFLKRKKRMRIARMN